MPASPAASALAIALAVPERLSAVESHVQRMEDALLFLASEVGKQRSALTADVDDIVAHQGLAIRRTLEEVLDRLPEPKPEPSPAEPPAPQSRRERRASRRVRRREEKLQRRDARRVGRAARRARRRQLTIPSLFLIAGLAGGTGVALSPYTADGERCEGPLAPVVSELQGAQPSAPTSAKCDQAAADRLLLATLPALGGVMATVAVVVMSDSSRSERSPRKRASATSG